MLDICCVISGTYPAYLAGIFTSFFKVTLYVAKTKPPILEPLFRSNQNFAIGPFEFQLKVENTPDYTFYDVTSGDITVPFKIIAIDYWIECGSRACLNFTEFIWNNLGIFSFKLYALVATPFDPPKYCIYNIIEWVATVGDRISSATSVSLHSNSTRAGRRQ